MTKHYDYIAIGGGSGGIASINRAAMYGQKCALIEAKELGGTCVNVGCVPKKVMWHAAQIREAIHMYGPDYGFDTTINKFNWETLIASRTAYIDRIHTSYENVLGKNNVDVIKGFARFVDAKRWKLTVKPSRPIISSSPPAVVRATRIFRAWNTVLILMASSPFLLCQSAWRLLARVTSPLSWLA